MRGFQQHLPELLELGARVVGISADTWAANGGFAAAQGLTFPLLSDWPENQTIAAFGVERDGSTVASRATFVFDAEGIVRAVVDDARDMDAHARGALAAVRELAGVQSTND